MYLISFVSPATIAFSSKHIDSYIHICPPMSSQSTTGLEQRQPPQVIQKYPITQVKEWSVLMLETLMSGNENSVLLIHLIERVLPFEVSVNSYTVIPDNL